MINGQSAGKSYTYLLGVYFGDGSITVRGGSYQFGFETIDREFLDKVLECIKELTDKEPTVGKRNRGENRNETLYFSMCGELFEHMYKETHGKKIVPDWVVNGDSDTKKLFLQGVMDSDGYVSQRENMKGIKQFRMGYVKSGIFVTLILKMMKDIGLQLSKIAIEPTKHNDFVFRVGINMQSWVKSGMKFSIPRKNDRVVAYQAKFN